MSYILSIVGCLPISEHLYSFQRQEQNLGRRSTIAKASCKRYQECTIHQSKNSKQNHYLVCGTLILNKLGSSIKQNCLHSIICKECTDTANKEQLSFSVRFVFSDRICELFLGHWEPNHGVSGKAISEAMENAISECNLDPTMLRGQAYDVANNYVCEVQRLWAINLEKVYLKALYMHSLLHPCAELGSD